MKGKYILISFIHIDVKFVVLEKTLKNHLDSKSKPANPKGNQSWIFIWRTNAKGEVPILGPPATHWSQLIGKLAQGEPTHPDAGKNWWQMEKGWQGRGWGGYIASSTQGTWILANSGR